MKRLLMLALVTGASFASAAPSASASCIPQCLITTNPCIVDVGRCDGACKVNVGYCAPGGRCVVNVGYCDDSTRLPVGV